MRQEPGGRGGAAAAQGGAVAVGEEGAKPGEFAFVDPCGAKVAEGFENGRGFTRSLRKSARLCVAQLDGLAPYRDFSGCPVGEVDDPGGNLGGESEGVRGDRADALKSAPGLAGKCLGDALLRGRNQSAEEGAGTRQVVESPPDAAYRSLPHEARERLIHGGAAPEIKEVLSRENPALSLLLNAPLDPA